MAVQNVYFYVKRVCICHSVTFPELKRQEKKKHKQERPKGPTADLVEGTPVIYGLTDQKATDSTEEEDSLRQTVKVQDSVKC